MRRSVGKTIASSLLTLALVSTATVPANAMSASDVPIPAMPPMLRSFPTAAAEPTISKEQALATLKRFFKTDPGKGTLEAHLNRFGARPTWSLSYTIRQQNGSVGFGISEIDAETGRLVHLYLGHPELRPFRTGPIENPHSEELARAYAKALAREMYDGDFDSLREEPTEPTAPSYYGFAGNLYTFSWVLYHGDVPVPDHRVTVSLDRETLDVVVYNGSGTPMTFRNDTPQITAEEALAHFRASLPELVYQPIYQRHDSIPAYSLVYRQRRAPYRIDAVSGEPTDYSGRPLAAPTAPESIPANDAIAVKPNALPLTEEQAIALSASLLNPQEGAIPDTNSYPHKRSNIHVHWHTPYTPDGRYQNASVEFDAATGLIRSAYRSSHHWDVTQEPTEQSQEQERAAKAAAIAVVQQYFSPLLGELKLEQGPAISPYNPYHFGFQRYIHDIPVEGNSVWVMIDPITLEWSQISANWTDADQLPAPPSQMITPQEAQELLLANVSANLVYLPIPQSGHVGPWESRALDMGLYYQLSDFNSVHHSVDPQTGALLDALGRPANWWQAVEESLAGHWAEWELRFAVSRGALEIDTANLDAPLSRSEALHLLSAANSSYSWSEMDLPYTDIQPTSPLYDLVVRALGAGWLRPTGENPTFDGDAPITRAEFAVWITRMLNLGDLAESSLVTQTGFTDLGALTREEQNAVAFLEALGILKSGTTFGGSNPLTLADGAVIFMRLHNR